MTDTSKQWIKDAAEECAQHVTVKNGNFRSLIVDAMAKHIAAHAPQAPQPDRLTHISFVVTGNDHALMDMTSRQVDEALENYAKRYMEDHNG